MICDRSSACWFPLSSVTSQEEFLTEFSLSFIEGLGLTERGLWARSKLKCHRILTLFFQFDSVTSILGA